MDSWTFSLFPPIVSRHIDHYIIKYYRRLHRKHMRKSFRRILRLHRFTFQQTKFSPQWQIVNGSINRLRRNPRIGSIPSNHSYHIPSNHTYQIPSKIQDDGGIHVITLLLFIGVVIFYFKLFDR